MYYKVLSRQDVDKDATLLLRSRALRRAPLTNHGTALTFYYLGKVVAICHIFSLILPLSILSFPLMYSLCLVDMVSCNAFVSFKVTQEYLPKSLYATTTPNIFEQLTL